MSLDPAPLTLCLFGPFEACLHGESLRLRSRTGDWLLALLVLYHGRTVDRRWLARTLWPESDDSTAKDNLRTYLVDLRRALGSEAGRIGAPTPRSLRLDLSGAEVDLLAFDAAIKGGALEQAVAIYRGPLLEDCLETWVLGERQPREHSYLEALETLAADALQRGESGQAVRYARRAVAVDLEREDAQRTLIRALVAGGSYAAALQVYRDLRSRLHDELHAEPDPETQALFQQILAEGRERATVARRSVPQDAHPAPAASPLGSEATSPPLPEGTVTFLFTDIEDSAGLWERHEAAMRTALDRHNVILRETIDGHGGSVFKTMGDQFCGAFQTAPEALAAALEGQLALLAEAWPLPSPPESPAGPLRVRMALHTGAVEVQNTDYSGQPLNRVARLLNAGHGGQVLLSRATHDLVIDHLPDGASLQDLGEHRFKGLERTEWVFQLLHPYLPKSFPTLKTRIETPHNLPSSLTSFVGRELEIVEVKQFLGARRLVALTGAGGCGKTRLAVEVAGEALEAHPDGVWLVELAALASEHSPEASLALVAQVVARVLEVREEPGRTLTETLIDALRPRKLLLVVDNCEHLIEACADLAETLLKRCPDLRIVATSRQPLGMPGEQLYRVPSLRLPEGNGKPASDAEGIVGLLASEAVCLFADRAALVQPTFSVTPRNAAAVVEVCRQLDGIPLAIELAAARVKGLSVEQIAARLGDRFGLLTGGHRTALPRQQTLRASIDWSYDLLSEKERALLCRLPVFAGGWTLEAAEQVCGGDGIDCGEILCLLLQLVEKSLVLREEREGEARYRLLETIREYGAEKLRGTEEAEAVRQRHRDWFLSLAEQAEPKLTGPAQAEWLARLEREHDNFRSALRRSAESGEAEAALRMGGALCRFWYVRGYLGEGREQSARLLSLPEGAAGTAARAKVLNGAGALAFRQGNYADARSLHEESLAIKRELGDRQGIANSLNCLGSVAREQGDYAGARSLYEESLGIQREMGDRRGIAGSLHNLAFVAEAQRDYGGARSLREESLAIRRELGDRSGIAESFEGRAILAGVQEQPERAARLFGAAEALREAIGAPLPPSERAEVERDVAAAREALGEAGFAAAWAAGRGMSQEEACAYALTDPADP